MRFFGGLKLEARSELGDAYHGIGRRTQGATTAINVDEVKAAVLRQLGVAAQEMIENAT